MKPCRTCQVATPEKELDQDGDCEVCAALLKLKRTMQSTGRMHPSLFDEQTEEKWYDRM